MAKPGLLEGVHQRVEHRGELTDRLEERRNPTPPSCPRFATVIPDRTDKATEEPETDDV